MDLIVVSSLSSRNLIDAIKCYQLDGYIISQLWYEKRWFWRTKYYASLTLNKPQVEFVIGPVLNRIGV